MFENPLSAVMLMQFLCFIGMLIMFLFIIRSLSNQNAFLKESMRQQQIALADLERQLMDMSFSLRKQRENELPSLPLQPEAGAAPSFMTRPSNDLLNLLDPVATAATSTGSFLQEGLALGDARPSTKDTSATTGNSLDIHLER